MYHAHWGLNRSPYGGPGQPGVFYRCPMHEEALARMRYLVDQGRRLGLLIGEAGTGKTMLLEVFANQQQKHSASAARVNLVGADARDVLWCIAAGWQLGAEQDEDSYLLWRRISDHIVSGRLQGLACVLLLDGAEAMSGEVRELVRRLAQADPSGDARLTLILAARPEGVLKLGEGLLELASLRIDLEPWDESSTLAFLRHALQEAGAEGLPFDPAAISRLHELAGGIPRHIGQLADLALLAGAGKGIATIDAGTVETVAEELYAVEP